MGKIDVEESLILDSLVKRRSTVVSDKQSAAMLEKNQKRDAIRKVSAILRKPDNERTATDRALLDSAAPAIVKHALKLQDRVDQSKQRLLEQEDPYEVIDRKARQLADWLSSARHLVCYTGAGISTAARIPDYRGTNGIWTRLQKGEEIGQHDLSQAEPTFTHMALFELHRQRILQYVLSQNCDGLHLRSGLPRGALSEVHGNMYVEVCKACKPNVEYWRLFDTTELTARYCHRTMRRCRRCGEPLHDTIVHFGERGSLRWPLNWEGAGQHAERADVILCLGSSLKVLKKYSWLWQMDRPRGKRPKLCIVNLQWTPKDAFADLKVNGKCDEVMGLVMKYMGITVRRYARARDPIFAHATPLTAAEEHTKTQPTLKRGNDDDGDEDDVEEDEETEAETSDNMEDDESFEEEEGEFGLDEYCDGLNGEDDSDSENDDDCVRDPQKTEEKSDKEQIKCEPKVKINCDLIKNETLINGTQPDLGKMKHENGNAIKSEIHDGLSINQELPGELLTQGTVKKEHPHGSTVTIKFETNIIDPPTETVNLISDSEESQSSASASTSQNSTSTESNVRLPKHPPAVRLYRSQTPPPPPVPFFHTSPLGLRTISPQRRKSQTQAPLACAPCPPKSASTASRLPYWYEPNYVYAGLHTIVHPAPSDVLLFRTATKSAHQLSRSQADCEFCLGHYAEQRCLFYPSHGPEHAHAKRTRSGRLIVCACCDDDDEQSTDKTEQKHQIIDASTGDDGDQTSSSSAACATLMMMLADDEDEQSGDGDDVNDDRRLLLENTDDSAEATGSGDGDDIKRAKLDDSSGAGTTTATAKVQPGWFGKGYRKSRRRRRM